MTCLLKDAFLDFSHSVLHSRKRRLFNSKKLGCLRLLESFTLPRKTQHAWI